ncbi:hypothetical protein V2G26_016057 [Clonostachys chloroleuca]
MMPSSIGCNKQVPRLAAYGECQFKYPPICLAQNRHEPTSYVAETSSQQTYQTKEVICRPRPDKALTTGWVC